MSLRATHVIAILLIVGVCWLLLSFFQFTPDDVDDFSTVTGTLLSADEHTSGGRGGASGYLEIRLREDSVRYCVPADGYLDYFRRKAFVVEVHPGATVQLTALASNIANPRAFALSATPTVFVRGVRVEGRDYCTVQDHIAWQKKNNRWNLVLAAAGGGLLVFLIWSRRLWELEATSETRIKASAYARRWR